MVAVHTAIDRHVSQRAIMQTPDRSSPYYYLTILAQILRLGIRYPTVTSSIELSRFDAGPIADESIRNLPQASISSIL